MARRGGARPTGGRSGRRSARRDERGATSVVITLVVALLVGVAAFGVDLGMQRVARRDMQALADAVALDLARLVGGRTADAIIAGSDDMPAIETVKQASEARNEGSALGEDPVVEWTLVDLDLRGEPVVGADGRPVPVRGSGVPEAVHVTARTEVEFAFSTGAGGAHRSAVGISQSIACFRLGSYAAAVDSSNSALLDDLLGDALSLGIGGYRGLANSSVTLRGLALELGVGSVDELVALRTLNLSRLYLATATVLQREGGETADVTLLRSLSTSVGALSIDMAQLMTASTGGDAALDTSFNVLDLVAASAFAANGDHAFDVPVWWKVPQFSNGAAGLQIIEKPQLGCGKVNEATAETAQVKVFARPDLNVPTIAGLAGVKVPVDLEVEVASARGLLTGIQCGAGTAASPESIDVRVSRALVTAVRLDIPIRLSGSLRAREVILDGLPFGLGNVVGSLLTALLGNRNASLDITVNAGVTVSSPPAEADATYAVPPHTYAEPENVLGGQSVLVPQVVIDDTDITGTISFNGRTVDVSGLLAVGDLTLLPVINDLVQKNVVRGVNEFIDEVNAYLVPTLEILGVTAGGADLFGVPRPTCHSPSLVG